MDKRGTQALRQGHWNPGLCLTHPKQQCWDGGLWLEGSILSVSRSPAWAPPGPAVLHIRQGLIPDEAGTVAHPGLAVSWGH